MTVPEGGSAPLRDLSWLHISDLHFGPTKDFERKTVLEGLVKCVESYRERGLWHPDLVFVTGDIANRGADKEYEQASEFFDQLLGAVELPKDRLFVVPGNHDVDRSEAFGLDRTLGKEEDSDQFFESAKRALVLHLRKVRAFREWHSRYFDGVRETDPFSGAAVADVVDVRGIKVGVLPISTATFCADDSDFGKLWIGRLWLDAATKRLASKDATLRVALLHHPLDWLHDDERAQIKSQLYQHVDVVLRGHLHETDAEALVSTTGSVVHLAAGAAYQAPRWPKRALFVGANIARHELTVHPIEYRKDPHRQWTLDPSVFSSQGPTYEGRLSYRNVAAGAPDARARGAPALSLSRRAPSRARRHERTWTVYPDGIADVSVVLTDVEVHDELILALPSHPYCDVRHETNARAPHDVPIHRDETVLERPRYRLLGSANYAECRWKYTISNAVALDQGDVVEFAAANKERGALPPGMDGRSHVVRFECEEMVLAYEFDGDEAAISNVKAVVESWRDVPGREQWIPRDDLVDACKVHVREDGRRAELRVKRPVFGSRYTLAFRPARVGRSLPADALRHADEVLRNCRASSGTERLLADALTEGVSQYMRGTLGAEPGGRASWLGFLWHRDKRLLLPAFGRIPNQAWSVRFPYGNGVAGHAFRFARMATWFRGDNPSRSVIFQPKTDAGHSYTYDYRWVVCVPLQLALTGPAIGIVSFASPDADTEAERWLLALAEDAATGSKDVGDRQRELLTAVYAGFWSTLKGTTRVSRALRDFAGQVLDGLVRESEAGAE